jgi:EAL domain-containing protein (putative c-di-GMP-specific phosphodiesterase class I)
MYQAKHSGENCAFYDPLMDQARQRSFFLRQELASAGIFDQLQLHFQPIVDLASGAVLGAEALLRWEHPTLGLLSPDDFISLAVESSVIGRLGRWVSRQVCETLREVREHYPQAPLRYLSFNVDARELGYHDFAGHLRDLVAEYGIAPDSLVLELTENSLIDSLPRIHETIHELQKLGFRWAIDDFGTGYSSLSYLQRLSLDLLKIDRSFSGALERDESAAFLIRHILEIARHLGYTVIVEGIETTPQAQRLREISPRLQCQGFHFSPPLPREAFFELLGRSAPPRPPKG